MQRKIAIGLAGALLIIAGIAISLYIRNAFVFNPLTFKQDKVTPAQWREYKYPLQVEYLVDDHGWMACKVDDKSEVKFVLSQLKKARPLPDDAGAAREHGKRIVVVVRSVPNAGQGTVMLLLDSSEGSSVATLRTTAYQRVVLPEELTGLISERLDEAEAIE